MVLTTAVKYFTVTIDQLSDKDFLIKNFCSGEERHLSAEKQKAEKKFHV